ncbi:spore coat U domain-containing protein [Trichormus sp. NMC-1]|uniref:Csu type fimbrial protein n=1 Tax=Trichormus sp. NMC-1 TaxID=1853259 RepID=UPI0008DC0593|nr:spore coat U domain-containing protein [Trichormus sp. NMC-1]
MNMQKLLLTLKITLISTIFSNPALCQCSINVSSVNFGAYDVFNNISTTSTGSINYDCSSASPVPTSITIDLSKGNSSSYNPRQLKSIDDSLNYNLYLDAAGQFIWGDGTNSQNYINSALTGTVTIYGIIPARQNAKVGTYTDSITTTINF